MVFNVTLPKMKSTWNVLASRGKKPPSGSSATHTPRTRPVQTRVTMTGFVFIPKYLNKVFPYYVVTDVS